MLKLKKTSRLGKQLETRTGSLVSGTPGETPKTAEDGDPESPPVALGAFVDLFDEDHEGECGVVMWVGHTRGKWRVGVFPTDVAGGVDRSTVYWVDASAVKVREVGGG